MRSAKCGWRVYKWIKLEPALGTEFSVRRNEAGWAATYEVNGCIIYADRRIPRKLVLPKTATGNAQRFWMSLNTVAMDRTLAKRQSSTWPGLALVTIGVWIIYYAIVFVSNFVSPECEFPGIYCILFRVEQFYRRPPRPPMDVDKRAGVQNTCIGYIRIFTYLRVSRNFRLPLHPLKCLAKGKHYSFNLQTTRRAPL